MRTIQKGPEPPGLTQHRKQDHASYDNYDDKDRLRQRLVGEQRGLCCYCQSRIHATPDGMKIEHWQCQASYPQRQLDYQNLLAVCRGNEGQPVDRQHCDTRKGNTELCFSVCDPSHPIEDRIRFLGDGRIKADDQEIDRAINEVLNLNYPRLVNNRREVLTAFQHRLKKGHRLDPERELSKWDGSQAGELPEFSQVVVYYLQRKLRK